MIMGLTTAVPLATPGGAEVYRDDLCAICQDSLPPDHLYCRECAATVDDLLHEIGAMTPRLLDDLGRLAELLSSIAPDTWDFLAEQHDDDPLWPSRPTVQVRTDGGDVDVDVDAEPGMVTVRATLTLPALLEAVRDALRASDLPRMAAAAAEAEDMGATH